MEQDYQPRNICNLWATLYKYNRQGQKQPFHVLNPGQKCVFMKMFLSLNTYFNLTLSNMDTSYHLGWLTEQAAANCDLFKCLSQPQGSTVQRPLAIILQKMCSHTHTQKKAVDTGCLKVVSKGFWIIVVRVVNAVSYVLLIFIFFSEPRVAQKACL